MRFITRSLVLTAALFCALTLRAQTAERLFAAQLESLSPSDPAAYYELAEEIADAASAPEDKSLARRLYVLAFVLAESAGSDPWIRPSACIALASLEPDAARRKWLHAVAALIDDRYAEVSEPGDALDDFPRSTRLAFAEFLGLTRAGRGVLARQRLDRPDMEAFFDAIGRAVIDGRVVPSLSRMQGEARDWPCRQCGNSRSVPDPSNPETKRMLCPNCGGNPGPRLSARELVDYVALEAVALRVGGRSWSAEYATLRTAALIDPDLDRIPEMFGVDPARSVYNSGEWVEPGPNG